MAEIDSKQLATDIQKRANALNISINQLCREAGVSRRWFEYFKERIPKAVEAYMKIDQTLDRMEAEGSANTSQK